MKKVIRLTESDLEKIVRRIIQEQQAPEESQGLWKDGDGNAYKLTCVNSNESWFDFVNFATEMYSEEEMAFLKKLGTQWKSDTSGFSPFYTNLDFAKLEKENDYKIKQVNFLHSAFLDGLKQVAIHNPQPQMMKKLRILDSKGRDYTNKILQYIPNYFEILTKLAEMQKKKLGCA